MKNLMKYLYFTACFMMMFSTTACAYLDPSVTTYMVQVIAGVAVAAGAIIGVAWRKAKRKVQDKLGIDENAKKEMEDEIVDLDDDE